MKRGDERTPRALRAQKMKRLSSLVREESTFRSTVSSAPRVENVKIKKETYVSRLCLSVCLYACRPSSWFHLLTDFVLALDVQKAPPPAKARLTYAELVKLSQLPREEAASKLGVCASTMGKARAAYARSRQDLASQSPEPGWRHHQTPGRLEDSSIHRSVRRWKPCEGLSPLAKQMRQGGKHRATAGVAVPEEKKERERERAPPVATYSPFQEPGTSKCLSSQCGGGRASPVEVGVENRNAVGKDAKDLFSRTSKCSSKEDPRIRKRSAHEAHIGHRTVPPTEDRPGARVNVLLNPSEQQAFHDFMRLEVHIAAQGVVEEISDPLLSRAESCLVDLANRLRESRGLDKTAIDFCGMLLGVQKENPDSVINSLTR